MTDRKTRRALRELDAMPIEVSADEGEQPTDRWMPLGACRDHHLGPDAWFPVSASDAEATQARKVCRTSCPVVEACYWHAMKRPRTSGIWGGTDDEERKQLRNRLRARQRRVDAKENTHA